ncbi:ribonuclease E/G [Rhizobium sp. L1K21]|uniref:Rne/Rng family ribonuclease n=1 Tax=Rhizobium sp. L1K21 TaxID=2954933 RepID=UPI002092020D|nr:ribonuclease E/G [Rhizobium sp. L1K21]MCO6186423.1 Rne/Rng family ribonuclease [Rhizobium sp. L1K21]
MADKMLIDASHEEETRVVVVRGNRIEEFDFESQHKKQLRGNIYLAKVTRVEPSLQAAFVDYGGNRHGFLAFSEIHPDYYQIPLADRKALLEEEARSVASDDADDDETPVNPANAELAEMDQPDVGVAAQAEEEPAAEEKPKAKRRTRRKPKAKETETAEAAGQGAEADAGEAAENAESSSDNAEGGDDNSDGGIMAAEVDADTISEDLEPTRSKKRRRKDDDDDDDDDVVESVGAEDAMEEVSDHAPRKQRKQYRIQEVIKRRQILLVQVAKEERGNKGAALTTYLSLAGRYSVLMPNTARGGGISRKITNPTDRKRLKEIARGLEVPQGMGVILRTAGANRTKVEIKRDFEYLMRLWENVRTLTLNSTAPCLVYEEGSLIKRSIRDLYNKDISEIVVAGEEGYREAKDFMKMLMPSHAKVVQPYRDVHPIFSRSGIEAQLDRMLQPQVTLKSGGYLIINQTEALVAIDVNSGRSTREHSIEETALATNMEAAEEVARQLRLRDLAGLVVIDFIDMEEKRNNRAVEKRLKDCLKDDRARIQVGRISHFGLLEMSRQRIRASVLESTMQVCSHCGGTGHVRSQSSVALHVLRGVEEFLLKSNAHNIVVRVSTETALYLLNHKRETIVDYEARFGVSIVVEADVELGTQLFAIDRGDAVENPIKIEPLTFEVEIEDDIPVEEDEEEDDEAKTVENNGRDNDDRGDGRKRRRRRRRRGRKNGERDDHQADASENESDQTSDEGSDADDEDENGETSATADGEGDDNNRRKRRRRGKRGGRRNRGTAEDGSDGDQDNEGDADADADARADGNDDVTAQEAVEGSEAEGVTEATAADVVLSDAPETPEEAPAEKPKRKRRPSKAKEAAAAAEAEAVSDAAVEEAVGQSEAPEETVVEETASSPDAEEEGEQKASRRTARTSSADGPIASEPVLTSNKASENDEGEGKPKKGGWWQRRGFF